MATDRSRAGVNRDVAQREERTQRRILNELASKISSVEWGDIAGTLSDQTDLQDAIDDAASASGIETLPDAVTYTKPRLAFVGNVDEGVAGMLLPCPEDDGTYTLKITVSGGSVTLSWEEDLLP